MHSGDASRPASFQDDFQRTRRGIVVVMLCAMVAFLDGLDTQSIALAALGIVNDLKIPRAGLSLIFSSALLGAMGGALTFGHMGERFGCKRALVVATFLFGVFTIATASVTSYDGLVAIRFLAGIGLGGATPCFISLATEHTPPRRQAMVASLVWSAFPLGAAIGALGNAFLISMYGWRTMFLIGGVLAVLVAFALIMGLPSSTAISLSGPKETAARSRELSRTASWQTDAAGPPIGDGDGVAGLHGRPVRHLFAKGWAMNTVLLWVPFFTSFGLLAIAVLWTPVLLGENGFAPMDAGVVLGVHGVGAIIGMASAGRLMERFGSGPVLVPALLIGAIAASALGFASISVATMSAAMTLAGLFLGLAASGSIGLATLTYPPAIRASGVGWAMGMGRYDLPESPLLAGILVSLGWSGKEMFLMLAIMPLLGAAAVFLLPRKRA